MGSAIAAHLANAGVPTLLLDMVPAELSDDERRRGLGLSDDAVRDRLASQGIQSAAERRPPGPDSPVDGSR